MGTPISVMLREPMMLVLWMETPFLDCWTITLHDLSIHVCQAGRMTLWVFIGIQGYRSRHKKSHIYCCTYGRPGLVGVSYAAYGLLCFWESTEGGPGRQVE